MTAKSFFQLLITLILIFMLTVMSFFVAYVSTSGGSFLGYEFNPVEADSYINVALLGLDKDGTRSDVIIVAQLNMADGEINMLQIPRDTYMPNNGRSDHKINSAYGLDKERTVFKEINSLLGLKIDKYVTIDTAGFRKVIDTIGGVDFYVPRDMDYEDPTQDLYIHLKKGQQHLDGDKAEQLVRFRGYANGDLDRMQVQSDFIQAAIDKIFSLENVVKINEIVDEVSSIVKTNFSLNEMLSYAPYVLATERSKIRTHQLVGEGLYIGEISYFVTEDYANEEIIEEYFTPSVEQTVAKFDISASVIGEGITESVGDVKMKKTIFNSFTSVDIIDASNGEADTSKLKDELKKYGYNVISITNMSENPVTESVVVSKNSGTSAKRISKIMGLGEYVRNPGKTEGSDITIVVGTDYKGE